MNGGSSRPALPEAWLRGPIVGVEPHLMPAAHALVAAREDLARAASGLTAEELRARPGGAASVAFHLLHVAGSIDRLLTYARGEGLSEEQRRAAAAEREAAATAAEAGPLLQAVDRAVERALDQMRLTPPERLLEPRAVGRAGLPSTVLGLLFHLAEHAQRHTGQAIATAKAARGA